MAAFNFQAVTAFTKKEEGGWANNPADPGGATEEGITFLTFVSWRTEQGLPAPSLQDLKNISDDEWAALAGAKYWNPVHGDSLPAGLDLCVFDFGFNAGTVNSVKCLQIALGFTGKNVDGWIGQQTLKAVSTANPLGLIMSTVRAQLNYYASLHNYPIFGKGWVNRSYRRRAESLSMATLSNMPPALTADDLNQQQLQKGA